MSISHTEHNRLIIKFNGNQIRGNGLVNLASARETIANLISNQPVILNWSAFTTARITGTTYISSRPTPACLILKLDGFPK